MHMRLNAVLVMFLLAGIAYAGESKRTDLTAQDLARVEAVTAPTTDFSRPENFEKLPAGAATTKKLVSADAQANLNFEQEVQFKLGNALFRKLWVASPSSTQASDGLGPFFNARGCQNCHLKDGRGRPPLGDETNSVSMFLRLSISAPTLTSRLSSIRAASSCSPSRPMASNCRFCRHRPHGRRPDGHRLCRAAGGARRWDGDQPA